MKDLILGFERKNRYIYNGFRGKKRQNRKNLYHSDSVSCFVKFKRTSIVLRVYSRLIVEITLHNVSFFLYLKHRSHPKRKTFCDFQIIFHTVFLERESGSNQVLMDH